MKLFTPPETNYDNYYEEGAFNLTWKINVMMLLTYPLLVIAGALSSLPYFICSILCMFMPILGLWWLKKMRSYKVVACVYIGFGTFIPGIALNLQVLGFHITEYLYMMISVVYTFIVFPKTKGILVASIQFGWVVLFMFTEDKTVPMANTNERILLLFPLLVGFIIAAYLILLFIEQRKESERNYALANEELTDVNRMVGAQHKEKTVMLKEIHHRVKNNLQVISSLLRLQSYEIEEEESRVHFENAVNRVAAMALIHEKMYQNENLSKINLKNYINTLATDLVVNHAQGVEIELYVHSEIEELGNDTLVPVALILNELVTNSLKHAFEGKEKGKIHVEIKNIPKENYFSFVYKDNGQWKPTSKPNTFGLELIATLIEQLDGDVERIFEKGTKYTFILRDLLRDLK